MPQRTYSAAEHDRMSKPQYCIKE